MTHYSDTTCPTCNAPPGTRCAALEAVAADIWDDAIDATAEQGTIQIPDNPYKKEVAQ